MRRYWKVLAMTYLVILWSLGSTEFHGPFTSEADAQSWLDDFEPTDGEGFGQVIGPINGGPVCTL